MCANPLWNILTIWKRKIYFWQSFAERTKMLDFILFFTSNDIPQLMWSLWVFPRKSGCPCLIWGKMADTIEKKTECGIVNLQWESESQINLRTNWKTKPAKCLRFIWSILESWHFMGISDAFVLNPFWFDVLNVFRIVNEMLLFSALDDNFKPWTFSSFFFILSNLMRVTPWKLFVFFKNKQTK